MTASYRLWKSFKLYVMLVCILGNNNNCVLMIIWYNFKLMFTCWPGSIYLKSNILNSSLSFSRPSTPRLGMCHHWIVPFQFFFKLRIGKTHKIEHDPRAHSCFHTEILHQSHNESPSIKHLCFCFYCSHLTKAEPAYCHATVW